MIYYLFEISLNKNEKYGRVFQIQEEFDRFTLVRLEIILMFILILKREHLWYERSSQNYFGIFT